MAPAVDLPSDWRVATADLIASRRASGRAGVVGNVCAIRTIHNHATDQVRVVVFLVVDDGEDLPLHTYLLERVERIKTDNATFAEDTIVERRLVLERGGTGASGRMWPVNLISLADLHVFAIMPMVLFGELLVAAVVLLASES